MLGLNQGYKELLQLITFIKETKVIKKHIIDYIYRKNKSYEKFLLMITFTRKIKIIKSHYY